jgi:hypothetical protein
MSTFNDNYEKALAAANAERTRLRRLGMSAGEADEAMAGRSFGSKASFKTRDHVTVISGKYRGIGGTPTPACRSNKLASTTRARNWFKARRHWPSERVRAELRQGNGSHGARGAYSSPVRQMSVLP